MRVIGQLGVPAATLLGFLFGGGAVMLVAGLWSGPRGHDSTPAVIGWLRTTAVRIPRGWRSRPRLVSAMLGGVITGAVTGWPVAAILTAIGLLTLPETLGPDRGARRRTERLEALAGWSEMLRDTLSAAAGLEQTILATADIAPAALKNELTQLATAVREGCGLVDALEDFAQAVDDPIADVVITALMMAAHQQGSGLAALLGHLAESVREQVAARQKIDASRASIRTGVRVTIGVTLAMVTGLLVFNRPYLDPFNTVIGQSVLAVAGLLLAASFAWLHTLSQLAPEPRLLDVTAGARVPSAREVR
ncbi:type II secretion protein F [Streptomyces sp. AJS327]|nr:type II secretion protein F [Streptomyces sp. AJS327]